MKGKKIVSTLLVLLLLASLPVSAHAATWDIGKGDITVNAESGGQTVRQGGGAAVPDSAPVITGSSTENTLTIKAESGQTANVTLSGANIDVSGKGKAAVSTTGEGNVSIELNGGSTLRSGYEHAGLEKNNGGSLTIADEDKNGKLTAEEAEQERISKWKRKGLLLNDEDVLQAMEPGDAPKRMCYSVKKDGTISGDLADRQQLKLLEGYVFRILSRLAEDIVSGNVEPNPYTRGSTHDACRFCPYGPVCHPAAVEGRRSYKMMDAQRFWEEIGKEMGDHGG